MKRSEVIAYRIRKARKDSRLKQEEVAQNLGLGNSTVSEWENGKRAPSMEQLDELAAMLNTSVVYLLGLDEPETASTACDLSADALQYARDFDQLPEEYRRLARGFMELLKAHAIK